MIEYWLIAGGAVAVFVGIYARDGDVLVHFLVMIVGIVAMTCGIGLYLYAEWQERVVAEELRILKVKRRKAEIYNAVKITVSFDDKSCSKQNGLLVKIINNSDVTLEYVGWKLSVYQPDCYGCPTKNDEKLMSYRALRPQAEHIECYHTPILQNNRRPQTAAYEIVGKEVQPVGGEIITGK